jgi:hypothetical protein
MSATLLGTGRGGYATFGGWLWMSRYIRLGPAPTVSASAFVMSASSGGLYREGDGLRFAGMAGLIGEDLNPISFGTSDGR